jgi:hypothetical protein
MKRITNLPQIVLRQVLSTRNERPATLTQDEIDFAARIMSCCLCTHLWVRRSMEQPERCPNCHKRGWNRPYINALTSKGGDHA